MPAHERARVVVTGCGIVSAIGRSLPAFTAALREGRRGIVERVGRTGPGSAVPAAALLADFEWMPALEGQRGLTPEQRTRARRILTNTTGSTRWSAVAAVEAFGAAGWSADLAGGGTALLVAGNNLGQAYVYENLARIHGGARLNPKYALSFLDTNQLGCLSEILGIRGGPGWTVGASSAAGTVALYQALHLLSSGQCERCLVVGAGMEFSPAEFEAFATLGAATTREIPPAGAASLCCPFDTGHSGFVWGEGAAAIALETEASAARRGAGWQVELSGGAVSLDGTHLPEPSVEGESQVMRRALESAGLNPGDVDYLNTHGSSSSLGDRTEAEAVQRVFGDHAPQVWLNATKALTGHCISASGVIEAVAVVVQMTEGFLHPNPSLVNSVSTGLRFVGPAAERVRPRIALSNSFGFGGLNASVAFRRRRPE